MKKDVLKEMVRAESTITSVKRRKFLTRGALVSTSIAGSSSLFNVSHAKAVDGIPPNVPKWMKEQGGGFLSPPYGLPSPYEKNVVRKLPEQVAAFPTASRTPLQNIFGSNTPNGLFFERHHAGVPAIDPTQHRLMLHGLVERPLVFTVSDLMRFPSVSRTYFIECAGNSASEWKSPLPGTVQDIHGLLSCAEWTGVPLSVVLAEAGVMPSARWVLAEGADAAALTRSVPLEKALDDALLVYGQNGEMLRPEQGYPIRLLLPGYEGNMNVKWLRRLKLGDAPFYTREETSKYTDSMPDGSAREFTFTMDAKSVITSPSANQKIEKKGFYEISGLAWTGRGRIARVEISTNGGRSWHVATLQEPILSKALTRFRFPWAWEGTEAILQSRAIDETGYVQPTRAELIAVRGENSIYHYNAIQSWKIAPSGEVTNVHA